jgi:uncharacterized protein YjiS (DUF1127 family)
MAINSDMAGSDTRHAATVKISLSKMAHGFASVLARIGAKAHSALKSLQMARMLSTLANMSDHQLAQIGIQRSDIPKYAETLMAEE